MVLPLPNIFNGVSNQIINKLEKQQNQENMIPKKNHIPLREIYSRVNIRKGSHILSFDVL